VGNPQDSPVTWPRSHQLAAGRSALPFPPAPGPCTTRDALVLPAQADTATRAQRGVSLPSTRAQRGPPRDGAATPADEKDPTAQDAPTHSQVSRRGSGRLSIAQPSGAAAPRIVGTSLRATRRRAPRGRAQGRFSPTLPEHLFHRVQQQSLAVSSVRSLKPRLHAEPSTATKRIFLPIRRSSSSPVSPGSKHRVHAVAQSPIGVISNPGADRPH
jgi:hypothetical protein